LSPIPCKVEVQPDGSGAIDLLSKRQNGSPSHQKDNLDVKYTPPPVDPAKRNPCDRCGVGTRSVFEDETEDDFGTQFIGGLSMTARGYYGGFWDTEAYMGEGPETFTLCHDCSAWLCSQIPKMATAAEGGHFTSNVQKEGVRHAADLAGGTASKVCCRWGVDPNDDEERAL